MFPLITSILCYASLALAQTFQSGNIPLAARSTFFNSRAVTSGSNNPADSWPPLTPFDVATMGWAGLVKVDDIVYSWLGDAPSYNGTIVRYLNLTNTVLTPTKTILVLAGDARVQINVTFFSPITPGDFVQWSIPFTYVSVDILLLDGAPHAIQIYSDFQSQWLSSDLSQTMTWNALSTSPNIALTTTLQTPQECVAVADQANWGSMYFTMPSGVGITGKIDTETNCRTLFEAEGKLDMSILTNPQSNPIFEHVTLSLSQDLGLISATTQSVVFAFGLLRSPAAKIVDLSQTSQDRFFFHETVYSGSNPIVLINDFLTNYSQALTAVESIDAKLMNATNSAEDGGILWDLVSPATRQTIATTELTVAKGSDGGWNPSQNNVMLFVRNPVENRIQPVELLYVSFPLFMVIDPSLGKPLLEPLLRLQNSQQYRNNLGYAANDLSIAYPTVTLANAVHSHGVEQTGNMLIMSYAQARFSGDPSLIENYYSLLSAWADYLAVNSLALESQTPTDSNALNDPNLSIKGIIAIKAMSATASALGVPDDATKYSGEASKLYNQ